MKFLNGSAMVSEEFVSNPPIGAPQPTNGRLFKVRKEKTGWSEIPNGPDAPPSVVAVKYFDDVMDPKTKRPRYFATEAQAETFAKSL